MENQLSYKYLILTVWWKITFVDWFHAGYRKWSYHLNDLGCTKAFFNVSFASVVMSSYYEYSIHPLCIQYGEKALSSSFSTCLLLSPSLIYFNLSCFTFPLREHAHDVQPPYNAQNCVCASAVMRHL